MEDIEWLVQVIQEAVAIPLCLDSPDPKVLEMAYGLVEKPPMINSISLEKNRYDTMLPFLKGKECSVLALCMEDTGMPKTAPKVVERAKKLVQGLEGAGIMREFIYVDPLVQPVSTDTSNAMMVTEAVRKIMTDLPGVHTICGLSNVSFGMPQRKALNRTFLSLMMAAGLDSAIVDPLDQRLMTVLRSTEVLLGQDDYCRRYLKAFRAGELQA
ncbi:MAG: dihydropteroate synthase [Deltaproteobacteria bacterium]|nr:dihydropteroate synthase [Deltaproteobacteria bacterium]